MIVDEMIKEGTRVGPLLEEIKSQSFKEYSKKLTSVVETENSFILNNRDIAINTYCDVIGHWIEIDEISRIKNQFTQFPIMQTADSCQLLYDPETFMNNFLFMLAMKELNNEFLITQQCSSVRMLMYRNPLIGPGYINYANNYYKVFNKSKKKLSNSNVATLSDVTFVFESEENLAKELPNLLKSFRGKIYSTAAEAFLNTNQYIWSNLHFAEASRLVQVDELYSSKLVAKMLEDSNHPLNILLFNKEINKIFIEEINEFLLSDECLFLRNTTDFFYASFEEELIPLRYYSDSGKLVSLKKQVEIEYTVEVVIEELNAGRLFPNLIISFLALSIFPMITVVGGSSQYEYVREIQQILLRTIQRTEIVESELRDIITGNTISTMLPGLPQGMNHMLALIKKMDYNSDFSRYHDELYNMKMKDYFGEYQYFEYFQIVFNRRKQKKVDMRS